MKKIVLLATVALLLVSFKASATDVDCDNIRLLTKKHMVCERFDEEWALHVARGNGRQMRVMLSKFGGDEVVVREMLKNKVGARYLNEISDELYEKYRLDVPDLNNEQVLKNAGEAIAAILSFDGKVHVQDIPATRAYRKKLLSLQYVPGNEKGKVIFKSDLDNRRYHFLDTMQFSMRKNGVFLQYIQPFVNKEEGRSVVAELNGAGKIVETGINEQNGWAFYWKIHQPVTLNFMKDNTPIRKIDLIVDANYERRLKGFWYGQSHMISQWNEYGMAIIEFNNN